MVRNVAGLLRSVPKHGREEEVLPARKTCLVCGADLLESELYARHRVCPVCRFHYCLTARERIDSLADPGSFRETNRAVTSIDPLSFSSRVPYKRRLFHEQSRTGLTAPSLGLVPWAEFRLYSSSWILGSWAVAWVASSARRCPWHWSTQPS